MGDYDFEPRKADSIYLRLKAKGDKVTVRLASSPYREPKVWRVDVKPPLIPEEVVKLTERHWRGMYTDPDYNITEVFHWKVIDRDSGLAKIYTGTSSVYKSIKEYSQMEAWGDPKTYDFQIERTEDPGRNYYKVTALPNKSPLTEKQQDLLDALDMDEKLPAARSVSVKQIDYIEEMGDENAGDADDEAEALAAQAAVEAQDNSAKPSKEDTVFTDIPDEPINLDDVPF